jgi:hypothetical protein
MKVAAMKSWFRLMLVPPAAEYTSVGGVGEWGVGSGEGEGEWGVGK